MTTDHLPRAAESADLIAPRAPNDALSFEELQARYNFLNISSYPRVLTHLILSEIRQRPDCCVLDVGCGRGIGREIAYQQAVREAAGQLWGVEPDRSVRPREGMFDRYESELLEDADLPAESVDVCYSAMVMEHVDDARGYLSTVYRLLKPGGVYLFATPNEHSFVPRVTKLAHLVKLDELTLRAVKGRQKVEEYHYPVQFKLNSPARVRKLAEEIGFRSSEFAFVEGRGTRAYFPALLRPLYHGLVLKRRLLKNKSALATLIGRLSK